MSRRDPRNLDDEANYGREPRASERAVNKFEMGLLESIGKGGRSEVYEIASALGIPKQVIRVQVPEENACPWHVTLGRPRFESDVLRNGEGNDGQEAAIRWTRTPLVANLMWGTGGSFFTAQIDWRVGGTIVLHGAIVQVDAVLPPGMTFGSSTFSAGQRMRFTVQCVRASARAQPTWAPSLTVDYGTLAAGAGLVLPVPPFARTMRMHQFTAGLGWTADTVTVNWFSDIGAVVPYGSELWTASGSRQVLDDAWPMPVPANARFCSIINGAAVNGKSILAEYQLDLG